MTIVSDMADKIRRTDSYQQIIDDLEKCSKGSPCADCSQPTKWNCDWMLMLKAKNALIELLHLHYLDKSEIVRLRRQIEVLQMSEDEKLKDLREGNRSPYRRAKNG